MATAGPSRAAVAHRATAEDVDSFLIKHGFDYLEEADENLNCPICRSPFVQPVLSPECGHVFCLPCLELHTKGSSICPIDRQKLVFGDFRPAPRLIHAMVDELLVKCPHAAQGCSFKSQRHLLRAHLIAECLFGETLCPCSKDCSRLVLKKDLSAHVEACDYALIPCPMSCGAHVRRSEMETHAETICPNEQVECAHRCGRDSLKRAELAHHYAHECSKAPVDCPHRRFGCLWRGTRRLLQDEHLLADCPYDPIKGYLEATEAKMKRTEAENETLKARLDRLEEKQERTTAEMTSLRASLGDFAPPPLLPKTRRLSSAADGSKASSSAVLEEPPTIRAPIRGLTSTLGDVSGSIAALQASLENLEVRQEATFMHETVRLQEEVQGLRAAVHGVRLQTVWLMMEYERRAAANGELPQGADGSGPPTNATRMAAMMSGSALYPPGAGMMPFAASPPPNVMPPMGFVRRPSERQEVKL